MTTSEQDSDDALTLDALITPLRRDEFLSNYWRKNTLHYPHSGSLLEKIRRILGDFNIRHLLSLGSSVSAIGYVGAVTDRRDGLNIAVALELYEKGYTLYFSLHNTVPSCGVILKNVLRDAGIDAIAGHCSIFASKTDRGLNVHYDQNENFTIQLAGEKTWKILRNDFVTNPIHGYRWRERYLSPECGAYLNPSMQFADLGDGEEFHMTPGAVLYHPAGIWHSTKAGLESISLNISIQPVNYFDLVIGSVAATLMSHSAIRRDVPPIQGELGMEEHRRRLAAAMHATRDAVTQLVPEDAVDLSSVPFGIAGDLSAIARLCRQSISLHTKLRRNTLVAFEAASSSDELKLWVYIYLGRFSNRVCLTVPHSLRAALLSVVDQRKIFSPHDLINNNTKEGELIEVCQALEAIKAIRVVT